MTIAFVEKKIQRVIVTGNQAEEMRPSDPDHGVAPLGP